MSIESILSILGILLLLFLSAFFSGSETTLTAVSRARIHSLAGRGVRNARAVEHLIADRERLIGALLLGNNLVNILASALATSLFLAFFGQAGVAYATLVMTALVLIFAEVLPKTYAISNPERVSLVVGRPVRVIVALFAPIVTAVHFIVRRLLRLMGIDVDEVKHVLSAHEELRGAIELHHKEGAVVKGERDMLGGILDLDEVDVAEVMIHRRNMMMVDADLPALEIVEQILSSPYTRVPLYRENPENIVGVIHAKDLLRALRGQADPTSRDFGAGNIESLDLMSIATEPWFVPDATTLREQLNAFRQRRSHFALVVDEYGALMGLVTLEDILEEIVGEISDEHDIAASGIRPQADGSYVVDGWVTIRDLNRELDWSLPDEEAATIAGLVIHEAQTIPEVGQAFTFYGFKFQIMRRHRNAITAVRVTPLRHTPTASVA